MCSTYSAGSCNCTQCASGWQLNSLAGCGAFRLKHGRYRRSSSGGSRRCGRSVERRLHRPVAWDACPFGLLVCLAKLPASPLFCAAGCLAFYLYRRHRRRKQQAAAGEQGKHGAVSGPAAPGGMPGGSAGGGQGLPAAPTSQPTPPLESVLVPGQTPGSSLSVPGGSIPSAAASAHRHAAVASGGPSPAATAGTARSGRPIVEEDWADAPLATVPTRPAGLPPESMFSRNAPPGLAARLSPVGASGFRSCMDERIAEDCLWRCLTQLAAQCGAASAQPAALRLLATQVPLACSVGNSPGSSLLPPGMAAPGTPSLLSSAGGASLRRDKPPACFCMRCCAWHVAEDT